MYMALIAYDDPLLRNMVKLVFNKALWFGSSMVKSLIGANQVRSHVIKLSDDPYDQNRPLGIVYYDSDWYVPFTVKQYFSGVETRAPNIEEYIDCTNIIYMTSDNIWYPLDIQIPHHSSFIGSLECNHPDKCTDNSEYDLLTGSISSIYTGRLAEGLSDEAATVS